MSIFTPTATSSFVAGAGFWGLIWSIVFKIEHVAAIFGCKRFVSKNKTMQWIDDNKVPALLASEATNYGIHGISNPNSVSFALGGTALNILMIFAVVPGLGWLKSKKKVIA